MTHALIFDSGVGGLSVVSHLRTFMPDLHLTYAADDQFRPYGEKTEAALIKRLPALLTVLVDATQADIVVLACNTASTIALHEIRKILNVPVIGVVPAIKPAARMSKTKTIGVLGTPGTVRQKYVDGLIKHHASDCRVLLHGSSELVAIAEQKIAGDNVTAIQVGKHLIGLFKQDGGDSIDTIVLACTHFPLLLDELKKSMSGHFNWVDSGAAIARQTKAVLSELNTKPRPYEPQTALLIGGSHDIIRAQIFSRFGFEKTICLPEF